MTLYCSQGKLSAASALRRDKVYHGQGWDTAPSLRSEDTNKHVHSDAAAMPEGQLTLVHEKTNMHIITIRSLNFQILLIVSRSATSIKHLITTDNSSEYRMGICMLHLRNMQCSATAFAWAWRQHPWQVCSWLNSTMSKYRFDGYNTA